MSLNKRLFTGEPGPSDLDPLGDGSQQYFYKLQTSSFTDEMGNGNAGGQVGSAAAFYSGGPKGTYCQFGTSAGREGLFLGNNTNAWSFSHYFLAKSIPAQGYLAGVSGTMGPSSPFNGSAIVIDSPYLSAGSQGSVHGYSNAKFSVSTFTWYHLALTYNGSGTMKLYKNGSIVGSSFSSTPSGSTEFWLNNGAGPTSWERRDCRYQWLRWFNKELSATEVSNIYNNW